MYKSIAVSPFTSTASFLSAYTNARSARDPRPYLGLHPHQRRSWSP